ncbi:MAG: hypothetical protein IT425_15105 [Pirellulales bacterium]|nr:hypothetical protein [Pirellulales bacterium]
MAGRPRTMAKRVQQLLERHTKLAEELRRLGKYHEPTPGKRWDLEVPGGDVDPLPALWRAAIFKVNCAQDSIEDLLCFLELKVDTGDDLDDERDADSEPPVHDTAAPSDGKQSAPLSPVAEWEPAAEADAPTHPET